MAGSIAFYISIPIISLCTLIMLTILIKLIYKLYILKLFTSLMPFIHIVTTICMVSCFLCGSLDLYDSILCFATDRPLFAKEVTPYNVTNYCIYVIILVCLFGLFIGRLFYTFSNTIYSLSNCFMYFIFFLVITSIICFVPAEIGYANENLWLGYRFSISIIIINDTILNVMCIALFIYKLRQISRSLQAQFINKYQFITVLNDDNNRLLLNEDGSLNKEHIGDTLDFHAKTYHETLAMDIESTTNDDDTYDGNQMNLINIIVRHTILSIISIFFNQLWYCCLLYYTFVMNDAALNAVELCTRTIYLLVNCFVLYLNLNINHWLYYSICKSCHLCCYHVCTKRKQLKTPKSSINYYQQMI